MEERERKVVGALSVKYGFNDSEAREYIKMLETVDFVGLSVGSESEKKSEDLAAPLSLPLSGGLPKVPKQGRPSTQRVENKKETEDEAFCALVEQSEKSGRIEYKKLEKKSEKKVVEKSVQELPAPLEKVSEKVVVDAGKNTLNMEEVMRMQIEKMDEMDKTKAPEKKVKKVKKSEEKIVDLAAPLPKVVVEQKVAVDLAPPLPKVVVEQKVVEKVVTKKTKAPVDRETKAPVDREAKDREAAEIMERLKAAKAAKESSSVATPLVPKLSVVEKSVVVEKAAKKKKVVSAPVAPQVENPPLSKVPLLEKVEQKVVEKVVDLAPPLSKVVELVLPVVVPGVMSFTFAPEVEKSVDLAAPFPKVVEKVAVDLLPDSLEELEEEVIDDAEVPSEKVEDEVIRHKGTMYLKSNEGVLYEVFNRDKVGKVDASGVVTLDEQEIEEELCTDSDSDSEDETVLMTDSEDEE